MTIFRQSGMEFEADQVGQGRDLVMFHSLLTDRSVYDKLLPSLAHDHKVTLLSLPGFGGSSLIAPGVWNYVEWIEEVFRTLKLPSNADLLGNGFGAFLATGFAIRHGHQCGRMILIGAGLTFPEEGREAFLEMARLVVNDGMKAVVETAMRRLFTEEYIDTHQREVDACRSVLLRTNPNAFIDACETLSTLDFTPLIDEVLNPTIVLAGEDDTATPPLMCQQVAKALDDCRYVEIPDCAHAPQLQRPDELLQIITGFLNR